MASRSRRKLSRSELRRIQAAEPLHVRGELTDKGRQLLLHRLQQRQSNPQAQYTYPRAMTALQAQRCARPAPDFEQVSKAEANEMPHRGLPQREDAADAAAVTILANKALETDASLAPEEAIRIAMTVRTIMMHNIAPTDPIGSYVRGSISSHLPKSSDPRVTVTQDDINVAANDDLVKQGLVPGEPMTPGNSRSQASAHAKAFASAGGTTLPPFDATHVGAPRKVKQACKAVATAKDAEGVTKMANELLATYASLPPTDAIRIAQHTRLLMHHLLREGKKPSKAKKTANLKLKRALAARGLR